MPRQGDGWQLSKVVILRTISATLRELGSTGLSSTGTWEKVHKLFKQAWAHTN